MLGLVGGDGHGGGPVVVWWCWPSSSGGVGPRRGRCHGWGMAVRGDGGGCMCRLFGDAVAVLSRL
jgi:hypothetical protein